MHLKTTEILEQLRAYESQNVTFCDPDGLWPIVWERAKGMHVWDTEGRRYVDWTAAFGVASAGHANPRVVRAGQQQMSKLLHAMGDVHPHPLKGELARALSELTFERWYGANQQATSDAASGNSKIAEAPVSNRGKVVFCNSGFEAVEAALKTAFLATGKPGVIAFQGAYHGLGYGALNATHRDFFRSRFRQQLGQFVVFVPFPKDAGDLSIVAESIDREFASKAIGAILVEPIQARGGINVPPPEFLPLLRQLCDRSNALLILDEIYTGFGRTGHWFACEATQTRPDLICLGKALTGGFPLSVCVGRADLMDLAWPRSTGEAIHTSTYLGHPVGCRMALAQIKEIRKLVASIQDAGELLQTATRSLRPPPGLQLEIRGTGLMVGIEVRLSDGTAASREAWLIVKQLLSEGHIVLPEGEFGNVIGFTPPLTVTNRQIQSLVRSLQKILATIKTIRSTSASRATSDA